MADAKKPEDIPVNQRLTNTEAHPSQTDPSKEPSGKAKAEKVTAQQESKGD